MEDLYIRNEIEENNFNNIINLQTDFKNNNSVFLDNNK